MDRKHFLRAATRQNFERLVLENSRKGLVLVDFWSPRAEPSRRQRQMLTRLAEEFGGRFLLVTVKTDELEQLAHEFGVRSLPSFKLFRHGRVVEEVRGVQPEADYRQIVERHLGTPGEPAQLRALELWQRGEADAALRVLADGAVADPGNAKLPLPMAKLLTQAGRRADAFAVLSAVPPPAGDDAEVVRLRTHLDFLVTGVAAPAEADLEARLGRDPADAASRYRLVSRLLLRDDYAGATEQPMEIQRRAPGFRDEAVRRGFQVVLGPLPADDPTVKRLRAELFGSAH
jgi:putative thioredoxin